MASELWFLCIVQFSSVQSLTCVWLFPTPWIVACQASLSITNSQSSLKLASVESVIPSSHLILCRPLFLLPPIPASIRVFSNESTLRMMWPKYWSFSFSIIPWLMVKYRRLHEIWILDKPHLSFNRSLSQISHRTYLQYKLFLVYQKLRFNWGSCIFICWIW